MVGGCCWQTGEIHTKKDSIARDDQGSRAIQEEDQPSPLVSLVLISGIFIWVHVLLLCGH
ncbi:hypothetical protein FPQ18DRAFT_397161 [Pyronema domesticum]|nr:hypothetical protein FPQ18DRAFT_397161 [Pyronema domesticum]